MIAMIVLTVLSSCTVRKAIKAHSDIPVARQLNPSKIILSGSGVCATADVVFTANQSEISQIEHLPVFLPFISEFRLTFFAESVRPQYFCADVRSISDKVPYYILYKKMKFWI